MASKRPNLATLTECTAYKCVSLSVYIQDVSVQVSRGVGEGGKPGLAMYKWKTIRPNGDIKPLVNAVVVRGYISTMGSSSMPFEFWTEARKRETVHYRGLFPPGSVAWGVRGGLRALSAGANKRK